MTGIWSAIHESIFPDLVVRPRTVGPVRCFVPTLPVMICRPYGRTGTRAKSGVFVRHLQQLPNFRFRHFGNPTCPGSRRVHLLLRPAKCLASD